jgi:dipeptidase E
MSKIILFSQPLKSVMDSIVSELFVSRGMRIAYMPSDGAYEGNVQYDSFWREYAGAHGSTILPIDNSLRGDDAEVEKDKIMKSDALILTGGNTFQFLYHLKQSGLDEVIKKYAKLDKIILGFSAGAIILSPTVEIAELPTLDDNLIGIKDVSALNVVDFDVYPHYVELEHKDLVDQYVERTGREVRRVGDDQYIIVNI